MAIILSACNSESTTSSSDNSKGEDVLTIYTSIYPLKDFTEKIGGDFVQVESIIPPGADSHTYEPTSKEIIAIAKGDAFIYNGLGMEAYAETIQSTLEKEDILMVEAAHGVETIEHTHDHSHGEEGHDEDATSEEHDHDHEHGEDATSEEHDHDHEHGEDATSEEHDHDHEHGEDATSEEHDHDHEHGEDATSEEHDHDHEHGEDATSEEHDHDHEHGEDATSEEHDHDHEHSHGDKDPHIWLDPYRAITLAENIKDALIELKPEEKDTFEKNFETLKADLEALDSEFHTVIDSKEHPEMIVSHAAYGYWEQSYGITQIPIAGLSPSEEPSQSELTEIVQLAKDHNIGYIIFEYNVTPRVAEIIREEINAEPMYLHNLETLTEDDIANDEDYFSLMKANLETLDKVLQ